ncbi:NaeI family type II restriction endonuclease [Streptomyces filamentosus]|uniref:NaeI family type II restriction endonuclease n=1 Tax=Streptomyces filamentosus TaxID=67294 RepID=UPI0038017DCB
MDEQADGAYCEKSDSALQEVLDWFTVQRSSEGRFRESLRTAVDEVLDGKRTGRFSISSLRKTEKTYLGTKVEIILQDEFEIPQGPKKGMDYLICGHEVDCKFTSQTTWEIPTEAINQLCLLVRVSEKGEYFSAGLLRARSEFLTGSSNKDGKRSVSAAGKKRIQWVHELSSFPKSLLLSLPAPQIRQIFKEGASGQERLNCLLRLVQNRIIDGESIDTVTQQRDGMARLREGKGRSRTVLRAQGILIAGHWKAHQKVLAQLEVPIPRMPRTGEAVAFRVVEAAEHHGNRPRVTLDAKEWVLADDSDLPQPGPQLPHRSSDSS